MGAVLWALVFFFVLRESDAAGLDPTRAHPRSLQQHVRGDVSARLLRTGSGAAAAFALALPRPAKAVAVIAAAEQQLPSTTSSSSTFVNGLISGAASRAAKEIILHPLDTLRAREQVPGAPPPSFDNLYDGVGAALLGGVPAGAIFFAVKDYSKQQFRKMGLGKEAATLLAVTVANLPYWSIRCPAEVLKTRSQVQMPSNLASLRQSGDLYASYASNLAYSVPADVVKFLVYEALTSSVLSKGGAGLGGGEKEKIRGLEAAAVGALAGLVSQACTTPLDVARTRIMTGSVPNSTNTTAPLAALQAVVAAEGLPAAFSGIRPRAARSFLSGAIQFASYELTQNALVR
jgi:solute carrier family 25 S-adenosylmethionine transporter 26